MAYTVSCDHIAPEWRLEAVEFADVSKGEWGDYRIGYTGIPDERRYYAIAPRFGCGRDWSNPKQAITDLLQANGCTRISVTEAQ
jgi:hypothetical protein